MARAAVIEVHGYSDHPAAQRAITGDLRSPGVVTAPLIG